MEKIIYLCDICEKELNNKKTIHIPYNTYVDSPSGKTEVSYKKIELCPECFLNVFSSKDMLFENEYEEYIRGNRVIKYINALKEKFQKH